MLHTSIKKSEGNCLGFFLHFQSLICIIIDLYSRTLCRGFDSLGQVAVKDLRGVPSGVARAASECHCPIDARAYRTPTRSV